MFRSILALLKNLSSLSFSTSTNPSRLSFCSPAHACSPRSSLCFLRQLTFLHFFSVAFILGDFFSILPTKEDVGFSPSSSPQEPELWSSPVLFSLSSYSPSFFFPPAHIASHSPSLERSLKKKDKEVYLTRRRRKSLEKEEDTKDQHACESSSSSSLFSSFTSSSLLSCLSCRSPSSSSSFFFFSFFSPSSPLLPGILASEAAHTQPSDSHHAGLEFDDGKNLLERSSSFLSSVDREEHGRKNEEKGQEERSYSLDPLSTHLHTSPVSSFEVEREKHLPVPPGDDVGKQHLLRPLLPRERERDNSSSPSLSLTASQQKQGEQEKTESHHEGGGGEEEAAKEEEQEQEEEVVVGQQEVTKRRHHGGGGEGRVLKSQESDVSREHSSSSDGGESTEDSGVDVGFFSFLRERDSTMSVVSEAGGEQGGSGRQGEEKEGKRRKKKKKNAKKERRQRRKKEE